MRLIQTGNVGVTEYLDKPNNKKWVTADTFERLRCEEVLPGDILISRLPEPAGRACIMPNLGTKMITAVDCTIVRTFAEYSSKFLVQFLSTHDYFNEVNTALAGGTRQRISRSNLASFDVPTPPTFEEQEAIGNYFKHLDHLITLHQRKYDSLVNVKKAMLEKMFPKNGETVPEIRFKGFTDAWEQRKLGEITESYSGGTPTVGNNAYYDGDIPFIRSGEISGDYTELFITSEGLNSSSAKMVKEGDILYALYGATSGEVSISKLKGAINQAILAIQPHQNYDNQFLMQWLKKSKKYIIDTYLQGGQGNLSGNIVKNLPVDLPTYDEQHQIGAYFKHLDNLITLHQRKLEKLKNIKKSCLEKMFVYGGWRK